ncbi:MAG: carbohydrate binding domain-containing protein [Candidatus Poribacteria bacterium]|nr:carbohydrate binding domain-containing protein [Candidatus Poribacteria bacterium]
MRGRLFPLGACLVVSVVLWGTPATTHAKKGENLVQNPDFEDGNIQPWTKWVEDAGAGVVVNMVIDKKEHLKGKKSLLMEIKKGGKNNKRIELHQRHFDLKKGRVLTYAIWAKAEAERPAKLSVNHRQAPWTMYGHKAITIQKDWQEFWTPVKMTADDNKVGIYVEMRDNIKGDVWFDAIRLYEGDYEPDPEIGQEPKAVNRRSKLSIAWGQLKVALLPVEGID